MECAHLKLIPLVGTHRFAAKQLSPESVEQITKAEQIRKRAKDLLDLWARKSAPVQLTYTPADIRIAGKLIALEGGDYLFRFSSGISTRILVLTYDDISVETKYLDILCVYLRNSAGDELTVSLLGKSEPIAEEFDAVYKKLREWVSSATLLTVHFGDDLRSTVMTCRLFEPNSGIFSFRGVNVNLTHLIDPAQAGHFRMEHCLRWTQITIYTHHTDLFFAIADGDLIDNLAANGRYSEGKNALQWCVETLMFK